MNFRFTRHAGIRVNRRLINCVNRRFISFVNRKFIEFCGVPLPEPRP